MKNLYLVEFGKPSAREYSLSQEESLYVIANSYEEAIFKVQNYLDNTKSVSKTVLTSDGSLNISNEDYSDNIKGIKLISNNAML